MDITWHGGSTFLIKGKKVSISTNPTNGKPQSDIAIYSHQQITDLREAGLAKQEVKTFDWPGEYETKGVPINGFSAFTNNKDAEDKEKTVIFQFILDGVKIVHLGALGYELESELIDKLGDVDVLFIHTGEGSNLSSEQAMNIIEEIEPRIVIPMGGDQAALGLKDVGANEMKPLDKWSVKSASDLPNDKTEYVLLNKK